MPNSCRTILKKAVHKGAISANDMKKVERNLHRWIPVSERCPEPNELDGSVCKYYLVQTRYGDRLVAHYEQNTDGERYWQQIFNNHYEPEEEIVAWCELPEPYKGGEQDGI